MVHPASGESAASRRSRPAHHREPMNIAEERATTSPGFTRRPRWNCPTSRLSHALWRYLSLSCGDSPRPSSPALTSEFREHPTGGVHETATQLFMKPKCWRWQAGYPPLRHPEMHKLPAERPAVCCSPEEMPLSERVSQSLGEPLPSELPSLRGTVGARIRNDSHHSERRSRA
jgi:hypothetical protein